MLCLYYYCCFDYCYCCFDYSQWFCLFVCLFFCLLSCVTRTCSKLGNNGNPNISKRSFCFVQTTTPNPIILECSNTLITNRGYHKNIRQLCTVINEQTEKHALQMIAILWTLIDTGRMKSTDSSVRYLRNILNAGLLPVIALSKTSDYF